MYRRVCRDMCTDKQISLHRCAGCVRAPLPNFNSGFAPHLHVSIYLSVHMPIPLSVHVPVHGVIRIFIHLSMHLSVRLHMSLYTSKDWSVHMSLYTTKDWSTHMSLCTPKHWSIHMSIRVFVLNHSCVHAHLDAYPRRPPWSAVIALHMSAHM